MSEYKGVPGPWEYRKRNWRGEESKDYYVSGDRRELEPDECDDDRDRVFSTTSVCIVPTNDTSHPVCENTVRLICAAPDLYEFARQCASNFDCDADAHRYGTYCRACSARDVIAKATGG
jgi:hypothetical protein